jgi:uncharacterized membrane protein
MNILGIQDMIYRHVLEYVSFAIGVVGIVVIVVGVIKGFIGIGRAGFFKPKAGDHKSLSLRETRYDIGFSLLLGLEFLIAADIILTIVDPTLREVAILGAIVGIRALIGYVLQKEMSHSDTMAPIIGRVVRRGKRTKEG